MPGPSASRIVRRPGVLSRVVRGSPTAVAADFPAESRVKGANESVPYLFDFTPFPEIAAGQTISSATAPSVSGITVGSATVTVADADNVTAGSGVTVTVSGGTAGTNYVVTCRATFSGGAVREIRLNLFVR